MEITEENPFNVRLENAFQILKAMNQVLDLKLDTLYLHLISDEDILLVNKTYLNHDYFTDTITFDLRDSISKDAEIFISRDRILENAKQYSSSFDEELCRICIHSMLHLAGYSDKSIEEKEKMTRLENKYLQNLFHVKP